MQTSTAIKSLDLNFNSFLAGTRGSGPGLWALATAPADFPFGRQICGQICKWSKQFKEFWSFYFCPNWRVYKKQLKRKNTRKRAFFLFFLNKCFQKLGTAPQHLNVWSNFNPPRCPLLSLSGQRSPPHKRFHISLEMIRLDYVMETQYCWERSADFFQDQISDISY